MSPDPRPAPPSARLGERLSYRGREAAALLGISLRAFQRSVAAGQLPPPDLRLGRIRLWSRATLDRVLAEGGRRR